MLSINRVTLAGRVIADPDFRVGQDGTPRLHFSVETPDVRRDRKTGETRKRTPWHRVVLFGDMAKNFASEIQKDDQVYVEGKLNTSSWIAEGGVKCSVPEVHAYAVLIDAISAIDEETTPATAAIQEEKANA
jgi:single-strand DNA-binding protein